MARNIVAEKATLKRLVELGMISDEIYVSGRKLHSEQPAPRPLVASWSPEEGRREGAFLDGDDVSFEDIITYATYTTEFSEEFSNSGKKFEDIHSPGDFIWWVFNKSTSFKKDRDSFLCPEECHISRMAYADRWNLLKVTFRDSTEVVYSRVPFQVFEILRGHAERGSYGTGVDRKPHTKVGIEFWNYVRIRGTRHGVQYPAYYLSGAPSANKGIGGKVEAEAGRARVGTQRTGKDGMPVDNAEKAKAQKAAPQNAFEFLEKELTASDIEGIRRIAGDLADKDDTITEALVHGDVDAAILLSSEFNRKLLKSDRTSDSIKNKLKKIARDPKLSEPYAPLIEMEKYAVSQNLWPL